MKRVLLLVAALTPGLDGSLVPNARAELVQIGSNFTVNNTNFVTTFSQNVTFTGTGINTLIDAGQLNVNDQTFPTSSSAEWVEFNFSTPGGGPLATNLGGHWRGEIDQIQFTAPVILDSFFLYWDHNGQPFSNITPLFGNTIVATNPITGSGEVYLGTVSNAPPNSIQSLFADLNPYNQLAGHNIDPNTANGWHMAGHYHLAAPAVPEPATLTLVGIGMLVMVGFLWRRQPRAA